MNEWLNLLIGLLSSRIVAVIAHDCWWHRSWFPLLRVFAAIVCCRCHSPRSLASRKDIESAASGYLWRLYDGSGVRFDISSFSMTCTAWLSKQLCVVIVLSLDHRQGEYCDDYLYENWESDVVTGIACGRWHHALLLSSPVVAGVVRCVAGTAHCSCDRVLSLALQIVANIVSCCEHRSLVVASRVVVRSLVASIARYWCDRVLLLALFVVAGIAGCW